jgi:hypothetical protein
MDKTFKYFVLIGEVVSYLVMWAPVTTRIRPLDMNGSYENIEEAIGDS